MMVKGTGGVKLRWKDEKRNEGGKAREDEESDSLALLLDVYRQILAKHPAGTFREEEKRNKVEEGVVVGGRKRREGRGGRDRGRLRVFCKLSTSSFF